MYRVTGLSVYLLEKNDLSVSFIFIIYFLLNDIEYIGCGPVLLVEFVDQ